MKCWECIVELFPENYAAFQIWSIVQRQLIVGFDGVVDIDHLSVWKCIDEYGLEYGKINRWKTFIKIIGVFHSRMEEEQTKKSKTKTPEDLRKEQALGVEQPKTMG